jgi:SsrA-binding protein
MAEKEEFKYVVRNRKARHDYTIEETFEAGIELKGSEVKSLRDGKVNMSDAYALIENGQVILRNLNITPYKMSADKLDPIRPRRLLLHARQIRKLEAETDQKGKTLVPLSIYFKGRLAKVELAVAVGRKKYDKREAIAKAEAQRRMRRALRKDIKD